MIVVDKTGNMRYMRDDDGPLSFLKEMADKFTDTPIIGVFMSSYYGSVITGLTSGLGQLGVIPILAVGAAFDVDLNVNKLKQMPELLKFGFKVVSLGGVLLVLNSIGSIALPDVSDPVQLALTYINRSSIAFVIGGVVNQIKVAVLRKK